MSGNEASRQLELDLEAEERSKRVSAAGRLADLLSGLLAERVRLAVHDNRSTMVSFRRAPGEVRYRVHHMFLDAPMEIVEALASFSGSPKSGTLGRRRAGLRIDAFVKRHRAHIAPLSSRGLNPRGRAHDLQAIFDRLNASYFEGKIEARIGWGSVRTGRRHRTVKTGVYLHDSKIIRIHPTLDREAVPEFYVAAVVFHEMLHEFVPVRVEGGRRIVHGKDFRRLERSYPDHARAHAWEERNLALLLSSPA